MSSTPDSLPADAPRRRNGRPQACEPCHRRKVACDHKQPVCTRCKRARVARRCVYLAQSNGPRESPSMTSPSLRPLSRSRQPSPESPESPESYPTPSTENIGFLGATSYVGVLQEARDSLPHKPLPSVEHQPDSQAFRLNERTRHTAIRILRNLPDRDGCYRLFKSTVNPNEAWCELAASWLLDSLWATFGTFLEGARTDQSLEKMALILCRNSSRPLKEDDKDPKGWFESFSGDKLRWECVGILFAFFALGLLSSRTGGDQFAPNESEKYIRKYMDCVWDCIDITRNMSCANTLLLYMMYKYACQESIINGDNSLQAYRMAGENVCLSIYLGLHASPGDFRDRSVSTQIKRRLFSKVFHGDKVVASFSGRPPLLSRQFVSTPLPLDISDEVLLGITPWRDDLVDDNGWNTLGKIYPTTTLRARIGMGVVRDSILEIALQPINSGSRDSILNLQEHELEVFAQFPAWVKYRTDDLASRAVNNSALYSKLLVQLEHLQNVFFMERLLNQDQVNHSQQLLQASLDIISVTLVFWTHQDRLAGLQHDYEWLLMGYAGPAAGILCLELLRVLNNKSQPLVSRSAMIQNLSLLTGFLNWIRPLVGNRDLCSSLKTVVQHVLDHALDPPPSEAVPVAEIADWGMEYATIATDFWDGRHFGLLDTFGWLRPEN